MMMIQVGGTTVLKYSVLNITIWSLVDSENNHSLLVTSSLFIRIFSNETLALHFSIDLPT